MPMQHAWAPRLTKVLCLQHFKCGNAVEIQNGTAFNFYLGLPHVYFVLLSMKQQCQGMTSSSIIKHDPELCPTPMVPATPLSQRFVFRTPCMHMITHSDSPLTPGVGMDKLFKVSIIHITICTIMLLTTCTVSWLHMPNFSGVQGVRGEET